MRFLFILNFFRCKKYVSLFFLIQISLLSFSQPDFVVDTILLPGKYIQKVSAARSSDVWVIENLNSRNIYRIDTNLAIYNHSLAFQAATNNSFTAILNNDTNFTFVGTTNDYMYQWKNNSISKINALNGLTDSTINGIVGFPKSTYTNLDPQVEVSGNTIKRFFTNDCINFTSSNFVQHKVLEREKVSDPFSTIPVDYSLYKYRDYNEDRVLYSDPGTATAFGDSQNWQTVNTATIFYINNIYPRIIVGTDNQLIIYDDPFYFYFLVGKKINKIIKYQYANHYALAATDSGLYVVDYFNYHIPSCISKPNFPENTHKANDVDISPEGCVWLATDTGLIKLRDINCNNFTTNFSVADTTLMLNEGCEIKFKTQCAACTKTWKWDFGDGTNSTTANPNHVYGQSGTYNVNLISSNGTCIDTVTKSISILVCCDSSKYNFAHLGNDTTICSNSTLTLNAGNFVNCSYQWSTGDSTQTINVNIADTYWVKITNSNGCVSFDTIHIYVSSNPNVSFTGLPSVYCVNAPILTLSGSPSGGVFSGSGILGSTFNPQNAGIGTHTVTYFYSNAYNCSSSANHNILVKPIPSVNFSGLDSNYCINSAPVNLTGIPTGGYFSGNGISGSTFNQINAGIGTHAIVYTYNNGCTNSDTQQVIVNALPIVNFSGLNVSYCVSSQSSNLIGIPSGGIYSGNGISVNSFNPLVASIGSNSITYNYTDVNGCSNFNIQATNVVPLPTASIAGTSIICSGETLNLVASGVGSFLWNIGDTTAIISPEPTLTTIYSVTASNYCGNSVDSILITVNLLPIVIISNDTTILLGNNANISVTGGISYLWNPATGLNCTNCSNPIATPQSTTTYSVIVTGTNGCSITKTVTIYVNDDFEIFVPDIFSPNGDGQNDMLYVRGTGIKEMNFVVYDRLGEKVFESNDLTKGWDGIYKGSPLNSAVFVYYLSATLFNDKKIKTKGVVTLVR